MTDVFNFGDENVCFSYLCFNFSKNIVAPYNFSKSRKMSPEDRAWVENLMKDLEVILMEDEKYVENNVVNLIDYKWRK